MMDDLFSRLIEINLAIALAILVVLTARNTVRNYFGAHVAYALWLIPLVALLAVLMPPRTTIIPAPAQQLPPIESAALPDTLAAPSTIGQNDLQAEEEINTSVSNRRSQSTGPSPASFANMKRLAIAIWISGLLISLTLIVRNHRRFIKSLHPMQQVQLEDEQGTFNVYFSACPDAGPALVGIFTPRIILPINFREDYSAYEQELILKHERTHWRRKDALINAITTFLVCLFWFNPLIVLAGRIMRTDQEISCDACVLNTTRGNRAPYARALVKAQTTPAQHTAILTVASLQFGCAWPAQAGHPLTERIRCLSSAAPSHWRLWAGGSCLLISAMSLGVTVWLVRPPVAVAAQPIVIEQINNSLASLKDLVLNPDEIGIERTSEQSVEPPSLPPVGENPPNPAELSGGYKTKPPKLKTKPKPKSKPKIKSKSKSKPQLGNPTRTTTSGSFLDQLSAAGLKNLSTDDLIALKVHNVDLSVINRMRALGFEPTPKNLIAFTNAGITEDYLRQWQAAGIEVSKLRSLVNARHLGVQPVDIQRFRKLGIEPVSLSTLTEFAAMGVRPEEIERLRALGIQEKDPRVFIAAKANGVTPEFIRKAQDKGFKDLSLEKLIRLKITDIL